MGERNILDKFDALFDSLSPKDKKNLAREIKYMFTEPGLYDLNKVAREFGFGVIKIEPPQTHSPEEYNSMTDAEWYVVDKDGTRLLKLKVGVTEPAFEDEMGAVGPFYGVTSMEYVGPEDRKPEFDFTSKAPLNRLSIELFEQEWPA